MPNNPVHAIKLVLPFFSCNDEITIYTNHVNADIASHLLKLHDCLTPNAKGFENEIVLPHCLFHFHKPKNFLNSLGFDTTPTVHIKKGFFIQLNSTHKLLYERLKIKEKQFMCQCKKCTFKASCSYKSDDTGCHFQYTNPVHKRDADVFIKKDKSKCYKPNDFRCSRCSALNVKNHNLDNRDFILNILTSISNHLIKEKLADQPTTIILCCESDSKSIISELITDVIANLKKTQNLSIILSIYEPVLINKEKGIWRANWLTSSMYVENGQPLPVEKPVC